MARRQGRIEWFIFNLINTHTHTQEEERGGSKGTRRGASWVARGERGRVGEGVCVEQVEQRKDP